jgi:PAS domain S-box-containing protein
MVALAAVGLTLLVRLALGSTKDEPLLELFLLPIILSAYVGGLGPGLLATAVAALLTNYLLLAPTRTLAIAAGFDSAAWGFLIINGALVSVLSEGLHRARRRSAAEQRLQAVTLASIGDAVITTDQAGQISFLNGEASRLTGWASRAAVGQPLATVFQIVSEQSRVPVEDPATKVLRTGATVGLANHTLLIARDGRERAINDSGAPIRNSDGSVYGVVLVFRDVSAQRQAEAALHRSEHLLKLFVEHAPAAIAMFDRSMTYIAASQRFFVDYQITGQPIIGRTHYEVFPEIPERWRAIHRRCLAGAVERADEDPFPRDDGTLDWVRWEIHPWHEASGEIGGLVLFSEVITARKQAEAEVRQLNAELERRVAERTAALEAANKELEAFSYSVSHDLRAPLRASDGFSRILLEDYSAELPEEARRYLALVRESTQQMGRLVDDLLAFSRLSRQPITRRMVASAELVRQCLQELHAEQDGRSIAITIGDLPDCQADPALLKQVWLNLISNALKYTRRREGATVELGSRMIDGELVYLISDNGVGFNMRYSNKLFGVFQRLHRAEEYEGTGVGLAIVQRIIHRHGGRVWAEAEVERGATFYFTLKEDQSE